MQINVHTYDDKYWYVAFVWKLISILDSLKVNVFVILI